MVSDPEKGDVNELFTIKNAKEHRRLLLDSMVAVVGGQMNVQQANAVASLSAEVHKSIKQEWDMLCYAADHFTIGRGGRIELLGSGDADDSA